MHLFNTFFLYFKLSKLCHIQIIWKAHWRAITNKNGILQNNSKHAKIFDYMYGSIDLFFAETYPDIYSDLTLTHVDKYDLVCFWLP